MCSQVTRVTLPWRFLLLLESCLYQSPVVVGKCVIKPAAYLGFFLSKVSSRQYCGPAAQAACQHAGVRKDVTRRQLVLMNLQIACQAKCVVTVVALAWLFLHFAHFITSVFWPVGTGRSYQHKGQKRSDPGECLQPIRFLSMCEQARCNASLPRAVRYEFCSMKCASWGQMQRLAD